VKHAIPSCVLFLLLPGAALAQADGATSDDASRMGKGMQALFDYLTIEGTDTAADFKPQTQDRRNHDFVRSLINPVLYGKAGFSAAIDQWNDKPNEWEQGASGYGKRYANIIGQYGIQRSVTFATSSLLHEDNRYFGSGKKGIWSRTGYAISAGFLARHDNGKRYPSVSMIGGFAAAAFVSRSWQPPSTRSAGDGAVSFGISMGYNVFSCAVKEFLPDLVRPLIKHRK